VGLVPSLLADSAPLWQRWLFGQPALVIVLIGVIAGLAWDRVRLSKRNDQLFNDLVRAIEQGSVQAHGESAQQLLGRVAHSLAPSKHPPAVTRSE
jgi:hypothetical protein